MSLTREQWNAVAPVIPEPARRSDGRGRPWRDSRAVIEGVLWVLRNDEPWKKLPSRFPPYQTCHRRFRQWTEDGTMVRVVIAMLVDLEERAGVSLRWMLATEPDPQQYAARLEALDVGGRRGRPDWRQITVETLLSPRMAQYLRDEAGWPTRVLSPGDSAGRVSAAE